MNLLATILLGALAPLVAPYRARFGLSNVEVGALVASPSVATFLLSIPIGLTADRIGARRLTLVAAALLVTCGLAHAAVLDFSTLLAVWLGFGIAMALISTASLAWLSDAAPAQRRASALSAVAASSGVGLVVGPALVGLAIQFFGLDFPFLLIAGATILLMVRLVATPAPPGVARGTRPVRTLVRVARRDGQILGAFVMMLVCGAQGGTISLLVGLRLHDDGLSAGGVGVAFSVSLVGFVLVSSCLTRLGQRVADVKIGALAALVLAFVLVLPVIADTISGIILFLVIRALLWGVLSTLALPIAADSAHRASVGRGGVIGMLMVVWAIGAVSGPLLCGFVAQTAGIDAAFAALAGFCLTAAVCMLLVMRTAPTKRGVVS